MIAERTGHRRRERLPRARRRRGRAGRAARADRRRAALRARDRLARAAEHRRHRQRDDRPAGRRHDVHARVRHGARRRRDRRRRRASSRRDLAYDVDGRLARERHADRRGGRRAARAIRTSRARRPSRRAASCSTARSSPRSSSGAASAKPTASPTTSSRRRRAHGAQHRRRVSPVHARAGDGSSLSRAAARRTRRSSTMIARARCRRSRVRRFTDVLLRRRGEGSGRVRAARVPAPRGRARQLAERHRRAGAAHPRASSRRPECVRHRSPNARDRATPAAVDPVGLDAWVRAGATGGEPRGCGRLGGFLSKAGRRCRFALAADIRRQATAPDHRDRASDNAAAGGAIRRVPTPWRRRFAPRRACRPTCRAMRRGRLGVRDATRFSRRRVTCSAPRRHVRPDATLVSAAASEWVDAAQAEGVLCFAGHFPGAGRIIRTAFGMPTVRDSDDSLYATDLVPFRATIDAGVAGS